MTEDEAKTKWCPQTLGRTPPNPEACGGSACMAWRWITETHTPPGTDPFATRKPTQRTDHGYCGLAGRPA